MGKAAKLTMKVLIVNTSENRGGPAVAAKRLMQALSRSGIQTKMLVRDKTTNSPWVTAVKETRLNIAKFAWERLCICAANGFSRKDLFATSIANTGIGLTKLPEFDEADIIHLHWVNQGFLSLKSIRDILESGKPVVWTMHDMWPCTGICHYSHGCGNYLQGCGRCKFINNGRASNDLSRKVFKKKAKTYAKASNLSFVTCSQWLKRKAEESPLLAGRDITSIPNPIDTRLFSKRDKHEARRLLGLPDDKKLVMFGSVKLTDKRKGIDYLVEACRIFVNKYPEKAGAIAIATVGLSSEALQGKLPFEIYPLPYTADEKQMAAIYNAADTFVTPSLEENLPNMVMEAMACGTPCIGFDVGGIPEMIDHLHNGYVAGYKSASDIAKGIKWMLFQDSYEGLSEAAIRKVRECYSERNVAKRYIEVYNKSLSPKPAK